ncbi:hypothetical protein Q1695_003985 [Nippostrongylus brasiliensis]|nr:hypothetical protein Q1695_003985 [Nippostrongylus brasiliensis]
MFARGSTRVRYQDQQGAAPTSWPVFSSTMDELEMPFVLAVLDLCLNTLLFDFIGSLSDETSEDNYTVQVPTIWRTATSRELTAIMTTQNYTGTVTQEELKILTSMMTSLMFGEGMVLCYWLVCEILRGEATPEQADKNPPPSWASLLKRSTTSDPSAAPKYIPPPLRHISPARNNVVPLGMSVEYCTSEEVLSETRSAIEKWLDGHHLRPLAGRHFSEKTFGEVPCGKLRKRLEEYLKGGDLLKKRVKRQFEYNEDLIDKDSIEFCEKMIEKLNKLLSL